MKNIFSQVEPSVEVHEAFAAQRQAGEQPQAPSCVPVVPVHPPVPPRIGEGMANEAGNFLDWKRTSVR